MRKSSKGKFRMIAALILSVFIVASSGVPTYAASGVDRSKLASLRIQPRYGNTDIAGGTFAVYQVATISDYNMLTYELVYPFSLS